MKRALATLALLAATPAAADPFVSLANQRNILPGGRAAMMGGAFVALADDSSASYYNPAGLAFMKENRIEFSATAYQQAQIEYRDTINEEPFVENSEVIFPNFIGGTSKFAWLTLGYSFMTLDARNIYQQTKYNDVSSAPGLPNTYSRTYQETSTYIWTGGSAAIKLSDRLSLGSSVFYYQRNINFSSNEIQYLNGGGFINIDGTLSTLNTGLASVNGLMWREKSYSLGMSVKTAMALSDRSILIIDQLEYDPVAGERDGNGDVVPVATNSRYKHKALNELNPTTYSFGAAWTPDPMFTLSSEFLVHEGVNSAYKDRGGFDLHTTMNYSVGADLNLTYFNFMAGYFTNNSMYRQPDPDYAGQPAWIDMVGVTGGLGWNIGGLHGQAGMVKQSGIGKAQVKGGSPAIQEAHAETTTYIIAGKVPL